MQIRRESQAGKTSEQSSGLRIFIKLAEYDTGCLYIRTDVETK